LLGFLLLTAFFGFSSSYFGSSNANASYVVTLPGLGFLSPRSKFCSFEAQHALPMVASNIFFEEKLYNIDLTLILNIE